MKIIVLFLYLYSITINAHADMIYPFHADTAYRNKVTAGLKAVKKSMSETEVIGLLGIPTDRKKTYDPTYMTKVVGYYLYYLLAQAKEKGSYDERAVEAVIVDFDSQGRVIGTRTIGLD